MSPVSEPSRGRPALLSVAIVMAIVFALGTLTAPAAAEPGPGLASPSLAQATPSRSSRLPVLFASHHEEEEEHDDEDHEDEEDLGWEVAHLEVERLALETFFGGLELIEKISVLAADDDNASVLAVTTVTDELDLPESKLKNFLREVANEAPSKAARRIARMKLAEIYGEEGDYEAALAEMRTVIFGARK